MNRFSFEEGRMALVSRGQPMPAPVAMRGGRAPAPGRAFACKTCGRVFPSFQALGGHRASHKKPRLDGDGGELKPKLHGCSICGVEFAIGQALGGHMRRHRPMAPASGTMRPMAAIKKPSGTGGVDGVKRGVWLDLNRPPCDDGDGAGSDTDHHGVCGHDSAAAGYTFHQFLDTAGTMAVGCV